MKKKFELLSTIERPNYTKNKQTKIGIKIAHKRAEVLEFVETFINILKLDI